MSKPLTKKEWESSVTKMWESAIESTYRDLIARAVKAEREACARLCEKQANDGTEGEWDTCCLALAKKIRARRKP